jgi:hypothetical protein
MAEHDESPSLTGHSSASFEDRLAEAERRDAENLWERCQQQQQAASAPVSRDASPTTPTNARKKRRNSRPAWAINDEPRPIQPLTYEISGGPPAKDSLEWNKRAANLMSRFPGTPAETIQTALSLTSGHGGKAEAELERITGSKAVDAVPSGLAAFGAHEAGERGAPGVSDVLEQALHRTHRPPRPQPARGVPVR